MTGEPFIVFLKRLTHNAGRSIYLVWSSDAAQSAEGCRPWCAASFERLRWPMRHCEMSAYQRSAS